MSSTGDHSDTSHPLSSTNPETKPSDAKLNTTLAMVADPKFPLPVLDDSSSVVRYMQSFTVLSAILATGLFFAYSIDTELMRIASPQVLMPLAFSMVMGVLLWTGTAWIDWWELVLGYWWISMPIGAAAGLVLVLKQETDAALHEMA